jgi:hypothetical protein
MYEKSGSDHKKEKRKRWRLIWILCTSHTKNELI